MSTDGVGFVGGVSRRDLLRWSLGGALAAGPTIFVRRASDAQERTLKVLHVTHPVPGYDRYLERFAKAFGEARAARVVVDAVAASELPAAIAADVAGRGGHDVFPLHGVGAAPHEHVLADVTDLATRLDTEFGGFLDEARRLAVVRGRWLCVPHAYTSLPWIINRRHFSAVREDYTDKTSWEDLRRIGAKLKAAGRPLGIPMSRSAGANARLLPLMLAFEAYTFDRDGHVELARRAIAQVLRFGAALYKEAMTPEVLGWGSGASSRFIASGKGAAVCDSVAAYRAAARDRPEVYRHLEIVKPPLGVDALRVGGARGVAHGIYGFSTAQDLAREFLYALNRDTLQGFEASAGMSHPSLQAFTRKPMPLLGGDPRLHVLQDFPRYVRLVGYPGPTTRTAAAMYARFVIPTMFAAVATGAKTPRQAMEDAEAALRSA